MSFNNDELPRAVREAQSGNEEWADDFDLQDVQAHHNPSLDSGKSFNKKDLQGLIDKFPDHPDLFCKTLLSYKGKPFILSPKQMDMIDANRNCRFTVSIFSRQSGKSLGSSGDEVHDQCFAEPYSVNTIIYAPILNQADIIFGDVRAFVKSSEIVLGYVERITKSLIEFKNGNKITVQSASESAHIRGFSPTKIKVDESQDITDRVYYEDILPSGAATGAKVQETGTPKGRSHFYDTFVEYQKMDQKKARVITQTYLECPFMDMEYVDMMKRKIPRASFEQEFMLKWNFDSGSTWGWNILRMLFSEEYMSIPEPYNPIYQFFAGVDVGKSPAETVVSIGKTDIKQTDDSLLEQVFLDRISHESYTTIMEMVKEDLEDYRTFLTMVDATGVGVPVYDILSESMSGIEPFTYTQDSKERMISQFTVMIEGEEKEVVVSEEDPEKEVDITKPCPRVRLLDIEEQVVQFEKFEKKKLPSGRYRYHAPSGVKDDIVNAVLLMTEAAVSYGSHVSKFKAGRDLTVVSSLNQQRNRQSLMNYDRNSFIKSFR